MKNLKYSIIYLCYLLFFGLMLFAYDGTIYGGYDGSFSRDEFIQQASDEEVAYSVIEKMEPKKVIKFFNIDEDTLDAEDAQLIDDVDTYVEDNYKVKHKDAYSFVVIRSKDGKHTDGWVVLLHYLKGADSAYYHYIYYFSAEF